MMWNERYSEEGFAYGKSPNTFLVDCVETYLPNSGLSGLCIADGEGRNSMYLGKTGFFTHVHAMDLSDVGIRKLQEWSKEEGLDSIVHASVNDLSVYDFISDSPEKGGFDVIVSIFAHTPPVIRQRCHELVQSALKPGGYFFLEAYTPSNVGRGVGGPKTPTDCMSEAILKEEIKGLETISVKEVERHIEEGKYHSGLSATVQYVGRKAL